MSSEEAYIVSSDIITPYGYGVDACWDGLLSGKHALTKVRRFGTLAFQSDYAGTIEGVEYGKEDSLVMQMLKRLFDEPGLDIPKDSRLILASTKGEVDLLERAIAHGDTGFTECSLTSLLPKLKALIGVADHGIVISAACASASVGLARAASMIRGGEADSIVVVACDSVSEFVFSGFSSLMALEKTFAKPFDKNRNGLTLGEAAGYALVMSSSRAKREGREASGKISGWGLSSDANHITGPSRDGKLLADAMDKAIKMGSEEGERIGSVCAHGTGTVFNDAMEIKAFKRVFAKEMKPVYSLKGALGHTMGASGLIEALLALRSLTERTTPPNINLEKVDEEAKGWVFADGHPFAKGMSAISTNSGFGGINAALLLSLPS